MGGLCAFTILEFLVCQVEGSAMSGCNMKKDAIFFFFTVTLFSITHTNSDGVFVVQAGLELPT